ncbi:MAG: amino acid ABC transporter permease [Spirochaetaceae bacterium]|jgi:L-cystine transport system permease protein|nr:amino acid ABC transporter permease [Spirochaetaceae bacterium]
MPEFFRWENALYFLPKVISALPVTLGIVLVATASGLVLGLAVALLQVERVPAARRLCRLYVSFIRGTPIIIQMFIVYYGLPLLLMKIGIDITRTDKIWFVYITYGINSGAYFSEIFRSAILAAPGSQWDAAAAFGLTRAQTYRRLILPQSVVIAIPAFGTMMTGLLQDTSLAFTLGILDVIGRVRALGALTSRILEGYVVAALVFVALSLALEKLFGFIEKRATHQAAVS